MPAGVKRRSAFKAAGPGDLCPRDRRPAGVRRADDRSGEALVPVGVGQLRYGQDRVTEVAALLRPR
ncbi:hypothetical protein DCW30_15555 [Streptomyces alfalfae]|uniref:Uncharacterized protein n=1 Tax=Streptomyces alfalfae TaxID=1642299 RepID=A0ABN4VRJ9_9ACTN|nr:hypothetical protein A7J05_31760 [Streptomyces alfalfae]AYA20103.1 hypothetical protein D3X13_31040 [Streptomyces fradiae]RXX43594.1 hypothetical protein DCW30_15555 [Streptomyces alfalfae]RZN01430.1 hypothetical protein D4104_07620 [Streptomyces alfalfae]